MFAVTAPALGWFVSAWADHPGPITNQHPPTRAHRVAELLDSLPPDVDVSGVIFADEMPPRLMVVDFDIDDQWCWVVECVNDALAERDQYPVWIVGVGAADFFAAMAATGPGSYNACVAQAQANCNAGKVCWVALVGPQQTCIWNCKGSVPCPPKPPLTHEDVLWFVAMD